MERPEIDSGKLWWDTVTGPVSLVNQTVSHLLDRKTVFLAVPSDLPWRRQLRSIVEFRLREGETELLFDYIDCADEQLTAGNIPTYLMDRFMPGIKNSYRASSGMTIQRYFLDNGVLHNRVIWIKGMSAELTAAWVKFCLGYRAGSRHDGLFVIESCYSLPSRGIPPHICPVAYARHVSYYDALLYDSMVASEQEASTEWKQYIATTAAALCECDVELSTFFLRTMDFNRMEPVEVLVSLSQEDYFKRRMNAGNTSPHHPFSLIKRGELAALEKRVWKSQLQTLFSLIELERINFIDRHSISIQEALDTPYWDYQTETVAYITQYNERVNNAYDAEIGTLFFMSRVRRADNLAEYLFFLPYEWDRERLELLRALRNKLAHSECCEVLLVSRFLNGIPYHWKY